MDPLRVCRVCGLDAFTEAGLELFVRNKKSAHGYLNLCKMCHRADIKQRIYRTAEFIEVFRKRSPNRLIWCHFCSEEVIRLTGSRSDSLVIHSLDEDHENWNHTNKVPTHYGCHSRYHNTGEKSFNWKGDEASYQAKWQRVK